MNVMYRPAPIAKVPPQQAALFMNCLSLVRQNVYSETETERGITSLLAKRSSCGKDTLYFSLRYFARRAEYP
ncbi:hypothetical protein ACNKHM_04235 [Shigella sonnei]